MNSLNYLSASIHRRKAIPSSNDITVKNIQHHIGNALSTNGHSEGERRDGGGERESLEDPEGGEGIASNEKTENPSGVLEESSDHISTVHFILSMVLFLPRILIYVPAYYAAMILTYPFKKLYSVGVAVIGWGAGHRNQQPLERADKPYNIARPETGAPAIDHGSNDRLNKVLNHTGRPGDENSAIRGDGAVNGVDADINGARTACDSDTPNGTDDGRPRKSAREPSASALPSHIDPGDSRYVPKASISTIFEEAMEFDPTDHRTDDYFKSPLDASPSDLSIDLNRNDSNAENNLAENIIIGDNNDDTLPHLFNSDNPSDKLKKSTSVSSPEDGKSSEIPDQKSSNTSKIRKKKKKFVFPKLLFNFNIFDPPNLPKKTLVLDLDETLIHSLSRYNSSALNKTKGKSIEVKVMGSLPTLYHIYKRPFVEEFLSIVYQWFDLICFTASIKEYADPVIDYLEEQVLSNGFLKNIQNSKLNASNRIFKQRYYRDSCIFVEGKGYVKDLSALLLDETKNSKNKPQARSDTTPKPRSRTSSISSSLSKSNSITKPLDYSRIIIIDNSPISYVYHKDNGLMIEGWINDPDDMELMNLLPLLNSLRFVSDVRCVLSLKDGQSSFS